MIIFVRPTSVFVLALITDEDNGYTTITSSVYGCYNTLMEQKYCKNKKIEGKLADLNTKDFADIALSICDQSDISDVR